MKKSVLFLLALSGCVRLNYVDIPAQENSYKFRYVGENALVECVDEKLADHMCEKDGITPANGIWAQEISGKKYAVGDKIKVILRECDVLTGSLTLQPIETKSKRKK